MTVAKPRAPNCTEVVKLDEGDDSLDNLIQWAGKDNFLSVSRAGYGPVQWIQYLHAGDQQELTGWPFHAYPKIQMQKCDKCSREFLSPINYRRHIRVHHRLKRLNKDSAKNRDLLSAFWDKLSLDEAKEIMSHNDVSLEEVLGSSMIKSLMALIREAGFSPLPHVCLAAGSALLDMIQARPSRFPISSSELFSILDDASENTFLCGTAASMQRYIFDGEVGKVALEQKNLVACTSFLVEQKLVKAWLADKDAEALRCQKLLVDEEEAAQKRLAKLLERKRQKKLRQKEHKAKEQRQYDNSDKEIIENSHDAELQTETSSSLDATDSGSQSPDAAMLSHPTFSPEVSLNTNVDEDVQSVIQTIEIDATVVERLRQGSGSINKVFSRRQAPQNPQQNNVPNGLNVSQNPHAQKLGAMQKHGTQRDLRAVPIFHGNKIWSRKPKLEKEGESLKVRVHKEVTSRLDNINRNPELLIGSIAVSLGSSNHHGGNSLAGFVDSSTDEQLLKKNDIQEKAARPESVQGSADKPVVKLWRPASRNGTKGSAHVDTNGKESEAVIVDENSENQDMDVQEKAARPESVQGSADEPLVKLWRPVSRNGTKGSAHVDTNKRESEAVILDENSENQDMVAVGNLNSSAMEDVGSLPDEKGLVSRSLQFSSHAATAFLAQRWKEAIAGEHVKLVVHHDLELSASTEVEKDCEIAVWQSSDGTNKNGALGNVENGLVDKEMVDPGTRKVKYRIKSGKGEKLKYIAKQR